MRSVLGRVFLVVAFLLAQQTAFAHQLWHLLDRASVQTEAQGNTDSPNTNNPLCEQHAALGTVLGGLNGFHALALFVETAPLHFPAAHSPADSLPVPVPASRGPPGVS